MKNKAIRYISLFLLILVMGVIFYFSAQPADVSDETSGGVVQKLLSIIYPHFNNFDRLAQEDIIITLILPVRALAHFSEFSLLGAVLFVFLSTFSGVLYNRRSLFTFLFGLIYAVSDELHQLFVPGRACQILDVAVDIFGVFTAIILCLMLSRIWRRKRDEQ